MAILRAAPNKTGNVRVWPRCRGTIACEDYSATYHAAPDVRYTASDAREQLNKSQRRRQLVELRAARYATLLSIAKVSVGSVLQSGEHFITMVPSDRALQIEADIAAAENGYVHVGDKVAVKFATFLFTRYGLAYGTVRVISPDSFTAQEDERNPTGEPPRAELSRTTGPVSRSIAWSCATRHPALPAMVKTPMGIKLAVKRLAVSQSSRLYV